MIITSSAFDDGGMIPKKIHGRRRGYEPRAFDTERSGGGAKPCAYFARSGCADAGSFTHWTAWNIDPRTTIIKEESIPPESVEGENSAGKIGYFGPCPPPGAPHHYHFQLYALDTVLGLPEGAPWRRSGKK